MKTWETLLQEVRAPVASSDFGPRSEDVQRALEVLASCSWLSAVGIHEGQGPAITAVQSWQDALEMFDANPTDLSLTPNGHVARPARIIEAAVLVEPARGWWEGARAEARPYSGYEEFIPRGFREIEDRDGLRTRYQSVREYLYEYVSFLLAEVIVADSVRCTHFREMLPWFHAGHFPCGWDGDWPAGRMRVY